MPKIARVRLSDGRVARFRVPDGATPEQIKAAALKKFSGAPSAERKEKGLLRTVADFAGGLADSATLGFADEIGAAIDTVTGIREGGRDFDANLRNRREIAEQGGGARLAGQVAGAVALPTSKLAAAKGLKGVAGAAAEGAAFGAGYEVGSSEGSLPERIKEAPKGAAMGAGGGVAGRAVGSAVARQLRGKQVTPEVRKLADEGVVMTPGRRGGKVARTYEEGVLGSVPFVKSIPQAANQRSVEQFNVAAYNRALKPLGTKLPMSTQPGRDAIEALGDTVYSAYDKATSRLSLGLDVPLNGAAKKIAIDADKTVGNQAPQLRAIIDDTLVHLKSGRLTGESVRDVLQDLRGKASSFAGSAVANERNLGKELWKLHDELETALTRQNKGNVLAPFKKARESAKLLKRIEAAAAKSKDGVFTPNQFRQSVTKRGYGVSTADVARGKAPMQDLADAGSQVLPSTIPNSGSPERIAAMSMIGAPGATAAVVDPVMGALLGGSLVRYMPGVDRISQNLALNRSPAMLHAADVLYQGLPAFGAAGALTTVQQGN